jgi:predicted  nucleic acid-binding Zn-ribbon protein
VKQQNTALTKDKDEFERAWKREREEKEGLSRRVEIAERRLIEATQEVGNHRLKSGAFEEEVRVLRRRIFSLEQDREELRDKGTLEVSKLQRRLEQVSLERDTLKAAIADYNRYLNGLVRANYL